MSPEAQRVAIAEACGWSWLSSPDGQKDPNGEWRRPDGHRVWVIPSYLTDLNAVHEAEKVIMNASGDQGKHDYGRILQSVVGEYVSAYCPEDREIAIVAHATAAQRAEAFLRTLGKWTP